MQAMNIERAKQLAIIFIETVNDMQLVETELVSARGKYHYESPKHRGNVRRRSMDLTRALAEMRKA